MTGSDAGGTEGGDREMICGECRGTGVVTVRYKWRGVIGDGEAACPECGGTGKVVPVGREEEK